MQITRDVEAGDDAVAQRCAVRVRLDSEYREYVAVVARASRYLRDGYGLLFHHFVDGGSVGVHHLVELVDAAHPLVGQDQGAAFEDHLPRDLVLRRKIRTFQKHLLRGFRRAHRPRTVACVSQQCSLCDATM